METPKLHHWIGGERDGTSETESFESLNPEDDSLLALAPRGTVETVESAVAAAQEARTLMAGLGPSSREAFLLTAATILERDADAFQDLLMREIGSPIGKAKLEHSIAVRLLKAHAGIARRMGGRTYGSDVDGRWSLGFREPVGVIAGITPFNVPLIKGIKASSIALATGNPFVWLPSDQSPLIADRVASLYAEAGVPGGAFNVLYGYGSEIGDALVSHPSVEGVVFTGSSRVGRQVQSVAGMHGTRVTLELGGSNPLIVLSGADVGNAIQAAIKGAFIYQGQICMATSRVIVDSRVYEEFVAGFSAAAGQLGMGELTDATTMIGPIINQRSRLALQQLIDDALELGARVLCGNSWAGNRLSPTVVTDVDSRMRLWSEEAFGPIVCVHRAEDEDHAIALANVAPMLSAAVFARDVDTVIGISRKLNTAMVHFNDMTIQQEPEVPFGGDGEAGFGREGMETAIDDFTKWKWVTVSGG